MPEDDKYSVQITADNGALRDLERSWRTVEFSEEDGIGPLDSLHQAGDSMVAVAQMDEDGAVTILGSGVMVGPGLVLTATHVLDEFPRAGGGPIFMTFLPEAARAWLSKGTSAVSRENQYDASRDAVSDISLVSCTLNSEAQPSHPLMLAPMQVALPLRGERLWAIGFRHQGLDGTRASITPLISSGLVTQAFPSGRGERMPSPCLEVMMETVGGMSGGAVVNAAGNLVGIVSSSVEGMPSYVTLLWDAIRLEVACPVPSFSGLKKISLLRAEKLGLAKLTGNFERNRWNDITLKLSDAEAAFFKESISVAEMKAAETPALNREQRDEFLDTWNFEIETVARDAAVEVLGKISLSKLREFLAVSDIPVRLLDQISGFGVEEIEGVEDPKITSTSRISDVAMGIEFEFQLRHLYWKIEVSDEIFQAEKEQWQAHFFYDQTTGGAAKLLARQRIFLKASLVFHRGREEFADVTILSTAIARPRAPKRGLTP